MHILQGFHATIEIKVALTRKSVNRKKREGYAQLSVSIPTRIHKGLKILVATLDTSIQQWLEELITETVEASGYCKKPDSEYGSFAELITEYKTELLEEKTIPESRVKELANGAKPTQTDLILLTGVIKLEPAELLEIYKKSFPDGDK